MAEVVDVALHRIQASLSELAAAIHAPSASTAAVAAAPTAASLATVAASPELLEQLQGVRAMMTAALEEEEDGAAKAAEFEDGGPWAPGGLAAPGAPNARARLCVLACTAVEKALVDRGLATPRPWPAPQTTTTPRKPGPARLPNSKSNPELPTILATGWREAGQLSQEPLQQRRAPEAPEEEREAPEGGKDAEMEACLREVREVAEERAEAREASLRSELHATQAAEASQILACSELRRALEASEASFQEEASVAARWREELAQSRGEKACEASERRERHGRCEERSQAAEALARELAEALAQCFQELKEARLEGESQAVEARALGAEAAEWERRAQALGAASREQAAALALSAEDLRRARVEGDREAAEARRCLEECRQALLVQAEQEEVICGLRRCMAEEAMVLRRAISGLEACCQQISEASAEQVRPALLSVAGFSHRLPSTSPAGRRRLSRAWGPLPDGLMEAMDEVLRRLWLSVDDMDARAGGLDAPTQASRGGLVGRRAGEIQLLEQFKAAHGVMVSVLQGDRGDRAELQRVFGGDCRRAAQMRVLVDGLRFSEENAADTRLETCRRACDALERVLGDLGLGPVLRAAQEEQQRQLWLRRVGGGARACGEADPAGARLVASPRHTAQAEQERGGGAEGAGCRSAAGSPRPSMEERVEAHEREAAEPEPLPAHGCPSGQDSPTSGGVGKKGHATTATAVDTPEVQSEAEEVEPELNCSPADLHLPSEKAVSGPLADDSASEAEGGGQLPATSVQVPVPAEEGGEEAREGAAAAAQPLHADAPAAADAGGPPPPLQRAAAAEPASTPRPGPSAAAARSGPSSAARRDRRSASPTAFHALDADDCEERASRCGSDPGPSCSTDLEHQFETALGCLGHGDYAGAWPHAQAPRGAAAAHSPADAAARFRARLEAYKASRRQGARRPPSPPEGPASPDSGHEEQIQQPSPRARGMPGGVPGLGIAGASPEVRRLLHRCSTPSLLAGLGVPLSAARLSPPVSPDSAEGTLLEQGQVGHLTLERFQALPERALLEQVFAHYVGPGGVSVGAGLGLAKFRCCLRDCGLLLKEEAPSAARRAGGPQARLAPPTGRVLSRTAPSSADRPQQASKRGRWQAVTSTQADLLLNQALSSVALVGHLAQKLTAYTFAVALASLASRSLACRETRGIAPDAALRLLCQEVLVPLRSRLRLQAGSDDWDLDFAESQIAKAEVRSLFSRSRGRLQKAFARYAYPVGAAEPTEKHQWTANSMSRFAADHGLSTILSHKALRRLFDTCADRDKAGDATGGHLSFASFEFCLLALALRLYYAQCGRADRCLRTLLLEVNALGRDDVASFHAGGG